VLISGLRGVATANITLTRAGLILQTRRAVPARKKVKTSGKKQFDKVESQPDFSGKRRLSVGRRMYYFVGFPLLRMTARLFWWSYRVHVVIGKDIADRVVADGQVYAPCYWHQHTILCLFLFRSWIDRGFDLGFVISPSVDGEVPARVATAWGAKVVRGSAARTGAMAMRDIREIMKTGTSIVTAADGPLGPKCEFKAGVVLMSRIGDAPMIPVACAADRAWYLNRWDDFMVPKPFARIVFAIGEPQPVQAGSSMEQMEQQRISMQNAINSLTEQAEQALKSQTDN
jgi:lysophospholipid acyltransferase (LPLAT)-like uncharacterized protein